MASIENRPTYIKIYIITFSVYFSYALLCYTYMMDHGFDTLLVTDSATAYIPYTKEFMKLDSLDKMWDLIYNNAIYKYQHVGIITIYFTIWGKIASIFDNELFFNLQISIIFLSSFISIFVYKLLREHQVKHAYLLTIIYSFFSIHFYYSTLILRDIPVALLYVITFCYIDKSFELKKAIIVVSCIIICWLIRPQSAIFLSLFFFVYVLLKKSTLENKSLLWPVIVIILGSYLFVRLNAFEVYQETKEHAEWLINSKAESSTLNKFNILPFGISHIVKSIYIHISPIPSWSFINIDKVTASNNIMGLPRAIAVLYNYIILVFVIDGILNIRKSKINIKLRFMYILTLLYMFLQTESTEQRRIMAVYPLILLFAGQSISKMSKTKIQELCFVGVSLFLFFQLIGMLK